MEKVLWGIIGSLTAVIIGLAIKICVMRKSAKEIETAFADRIKTDTNTLIGISSGDKRMRSLAKAINTELRTLRTERHRFLQGDTELKNAVTNISHDLRTPLTAICAYLDLLEQEEKSEVIANYLEVISGRTKVLKELTEELFRYSIIYGTEQKLCPEPIELNRMLEESVAAFYAALSENGITPTITMPETKVVRILDRSALTRVFSNLLNNAVKYSDGDLDIVLSETGEIEFSNTAGELDEVQVGQLFDRFYTVEAARKSTGLGLSIAKTLVMQMNGEIDARYEKGRVTIVVRFAEL